MSDAIQDFLQQVREDVKITNAPAVIYTDPTPFQEALNRLRQQHAPQMLEMLERILKVADAAETKAEWLWKTQGSYGEYACLPIQDVADDIHEAMEDALK